MCECKIVAYIFHWQFIPWTIGKFWHIFSMAFKNLVYIQYRCIYFTMAIYTLCNWEILAYIFNGFLNPVYIQYRYIYFTMDVMPSLSMKCPFIMVRWTCFYKIVVFWRERCLYSDFKAFLCYFFIYAYYVFHIQFAYAVCCC
jgi:hypothetical protein